MHPVEPARDRCPSCGTALAAGASPRLCQPCLLRLALEATVGDEDEALDDGNGETASKIGSTELPAAPGRFADYELIEPIGRGAMGVVFKARQLSLDRLVALKVLDIAGPLPPDAARRFRAEASAAAALRHPSIVTIHEVGVRDGRHYLAMDLVEGPTLAELVARQPLAAERAARLLASVADAVQRAHEHGILHRDLKPSNILVDAADQPRVADFGLAKRMHADADLTIPGQVMGSPNFMSPEQARGEKLGPASDVHALGAVLYHCLAGRPPFSGQSIPDTLHHVASGEAAPLRMVVAGVPRDLETIAHKCLEKDPAKRYPDARSLAEDLRRFLRREPILARPISSPERLWRWCRRHPAIAGLSALTALLLLAVAIGAPISALRIRAERERAEDNLYSADMNLAQQALAQSSRGQARELLDRHRPAPGRIDRRGFEWRYLWTRSGSDEREIFDIPGSSRQIVAIPDTALIAVGDGVWDIGPPARQVFKLPSGFTAKAYDPVEKTLLAGGPAGLRAWSRASAQSSEILSGETARVVALSPDGRWMATGGSQLRLWERQGASWREVASRPRVFKDWHNEQTLAFSPDGGLLATGTGEAWANRCELEFWSVPDLEPQPGVADAPSDALSLAFSPDGRRLVAGCWSGDIRFWDMDTRAAISSTMRHFGFVNTIAFAPRDPNVFATVASDGTARLWDLSAGAELVALQGPLDEMWAMTFAPDGRALFTLEQTGRVAAWDTATRRRQEVLIERGPRAMPLGFSLDGQTLATIDETGALRYWDVRQGREIDGKGWTLDLSGVFTRDFEIIAPVVSGDLSKLGIGMMDGRVQLWDLDTRALRTWIAHMRQVRNLAFSPDGRALATVADDGLLKLWDTASGEQISEAAIPNHDFWEDFNVPLDWSADGRILAVANRSAIFLHDGRDARPLRSLDAGRHIYSMRFSSSRNQVLVSAQEDLTLAFWDAATGRSLARIRTSHQQGINDLCFSPDGRTLATVVDHVKLWNLATRQEVSTLRGHQRSIFAALFSPDGNAIATADYEGAIRLWSALSFDAIDGGGR